MKTNKFYVTVFAIFISSSGSSMPINPSDFTESATTETFEGILGNTVNGGGGVGQIGEPFHFDSGMELSYAYTTVLDQVWGTGSWGGPQLLDYSLGTPTYGLGQRGGVNDPSDIQSGTAFFSRPAGTWTYTFDNEIFAMGVYLTTAYIEGGIYGGFDPSDGVVEIAAYTGSDVFVESISTQMTDTFDGSLTFLGMAFDMPVKYVTMTGDYLVIDDLTYSSNPIPEPATLSLLTLGGMSLLRRRKA